MISVQRLALLTLMPGCMLHRSDRNAPGIADVRVAPGPEALRQVERPKHPGANQLLLTYGAFAGIGSAFGTTDGNRFAYALGPEVSLARGIQNNPDRDLFLWPVMNHAFGLNLGWAALTRSGGPVVGPLYLEGEYRFAMFGAALGWAISPRNAAHGPQATLGFGPVYLRGQHEFGGVTQVTLGLIFKGYSAWIWSQ
jgi:hypothetical protein